MSRLCHGHRFEMGAQRRNLRQLATHWLATADGYGGYDFGTPQLIACRWEDRQAVFRDSMGEEQTSSAIVYLAEDVLIGDYVYLGDATEVADPTTLSEARRVRQFNKFPDLRRTDTQRLAYL